LLLTNEVIKICYRDILWIKYKMNLFVDDIQFLILMNFVDIKIKSSNQNKRINKISVNN